MPVRVHLKITKNSVHVSILKEGDEPDFKDKKEKLIRWIAENYVASGSVDAAVEEIDKAAVSIMFPRLSRKRHPKS